MPPFPVTLGAIDAGSNAIRAMVATATSPSTYSKVISRRMAVRLGHGAFTRGRLDAATIDAAANAFGAFRRMFDEHGVTAYRAVATSAMRNAHNRDVLRHRIVHEANIDLEVIDGDEEARLIRTAVVNAFANRPLPDAIIDLGGGSLEVNLRAGKRWNVASLPIGTVRILETFDLMDAIRPAEAELIQRSVRALLSSFRRGTAATGIGAACGGNPEALARLFGQRRQGMQVLTQPDLERALPAILHADVGQRMARFQVRRDRAEVMGVAAVVIAAAVGELGIRELWVPAVGVRDGLILEGARARGTEVTKAAKARRQALLAESRTFAVSAGHDITHAEQVRRLAKLLFDELRDEHGLAKELRTVLEVAALLHDVGMVVNNTAHHKHGEYLVRFGRIPGLERPWRDMVAALVRSHRKSPPDPRHESFAALSAEQKNHVRRLAALLRIADGLDADHRQRVRRITAVRSAKVVTLVLDRLPPPGALDKAMLFEELFEVQLVTAVAD
jgi:exopolyphosphatase / guanosine-5'-triphosphate,3'-diphosphate pyrophosphatase